MMNATGRSSGGNFKEDGEAFTRSGSEGEAPALLFGHLDEQAQAEALAVPVEAFPAGRPQALEGLAEPLELVGSEPLALVAHLDAEAAPGVPPTLQRSTGSKTKSWP